MGKFTGKVDLAGEIMLLVQGGTHLLQYLLGKMAMILYYWYLSRLQFLTLDVISRVAVHVESFATLTNVSLLCRTVKPAVIPKGQYFLLAKLCVEQKCCRAPRQQQTVFRRAMT